MPLQLTLEGDQQGLVVALRGLDLRTEGEELAFGGSSSLCFGLGLSGEPPALYLSLLSSLLPRRSDLAPGSM
eukprot:12428594-Alexandrium_andersonii.AAC.1